MVVLGEMLQQRFLQGEKFDRGTGISDTITLVLDAASVPQFDSDGPGKRTCSFVGADIVVLPAGNAGIAQGFLDESPVIFQKIGGFILFPAGRNDLMPGLV